jgi:uncharacterized protein
MNWNVVRLGDVAVTPWLNGGGITRELLAWPHPLDWTVRFSVAEVERDGPFSNLAGVRRWFAVLSGAGVRLRVGAQVHELTVQSDPLEFDGAAQTECELLAGATRDFNLMSRQGKAVMRRVSGSIECGGRARLLVAAYSLGSGAAVDCADGKLQLAPDTFAWRVLEADRPLRVSGEALWMEIEA